MLTKKLTPMILVALMVVAFGPLSASADDTANLAPGARVRVTADGLPGEVANAKNLTGYFVSQNDSTISMTTDGSKSLLVIPRENLELLEESVQSGRRGQGAAIGLAVGAGMGALMGFASGDDPDGIVSFSAGAKAGMGAVVFGLAGTLIGAVAAPGEQWETVSAQPVQLGFSQGPQGETGFFISARF